jgi:hypothetical protein
LALERAAELRERRQEVLELVEDDRPAVGELLVEARDVDPAVGVRVLARVDLARSVRDEALRVLERLRGDRAIELAQREELGVVIPLVPADDQRLLLPVLRQPRMGLGREPFSARKVSDEALG